MRLPTPLAAAIVPLCLLTGACDKPESSAATTSASAAPTAARSELAELCKQLCDKDVACAGETAKEAAKAAGLDDVADQAAEKAVEKAKASLTQCKEECVASADKGAAGGQAQAEVIRTCLGATDCAKYGTCIEQASLAKTQPRE
ncbi:MAG: hypothetical protein JRI68_14200 [Deltaproteobacteria bacterium]|nr:hypothetical protein [Deltaproteobacteria bacterium]